MMSPENPAQPLLIRRATPADHDAMESILTILIVGDDLPGPIRRWEEWDSELEWLRSGEWRRDRALPNRRDWVAILDGRVVGIMMSDWRPFSVGIRYLNVWPSLRRRGIGKVMWLTLMAEVRREHRRWLRFFVDPQRAESASFYGKMGARRAPLYRRMLRETPVRLMYEVDFFTPIPVAFRAGLLAASLLGMLEAAATRQVSFSQRLTEWIEKAADRRTG